MKSKITCLLFLFLAACQTTPTKVKETTSNLPTMKEKDLVINEQTVILDARPFFQYSSAHLPQAYPIRWEDFSQPGAQAKGALDPDSFSLARKAARLGITPDTNVVVVGNGKQGQGEEGRIAWTLAYLGVKNVNFVKESELQGKRMPGQAGAMKNAPIWKPKTNNELIVTPKQLVEAVRSLTKPGAESITILDVRSPSDYLKKSGNVDLGSINMEWKEFIEENGRPRKAMLKDLQGLGWQAQRRIIVLSDNGVHSAMVTMVLKQMGFSNVGNLASGLQGLSVNKLR